MASTLSHVFACFAGVMDTHQKNCAVMVALEDGTPATRFVRADLRSSQRGGQELERLASAQTCADLPEGKVMCAGEALLFNTAWWHAGPGQQAGCRLHSAYGWDQETKQPDRECA